MSNAHGETSCELGTHLMIIADQLIKDCKMKRAACMIAHAEQIFDLHSESGNAHSRCVAIARLKIVSARLQQAQLQFHSAEAAVCDALRLCSELLCGSTETEELPACTHWTDLIEMAQKTHRPSSNCRSFQMLTNSRDAAKLDYYRIMTIARVVRDALCAYSSILCQQGSQTERAMLCALSAARVSRKFEDATTSGTALADCQVYTSLVQHIFRTSMSPFCILAPWHCDKMAAVHFLQKQLSNSLIEASPAIQQLLKASWSQLVTKLGCAKGHEKKVCFSLEVNSCIEAVWPGVIKTCNFMTMQWLADHCMHARVLSDNALLGDNIRLKLTIAYMSLFQVCRFWKLPKHGLVLIEILC